MPPGVEVPWLTYRQFGNLIGNVAGLVIEKQNWQPVIDAIWENRGAEDYDAQSSAVKTDFVRKWHHDRSGRPYSLDKMTEVEVFDTAGSRGEFEQSVLSPMQINTFAEGCISERDREILRLRMGGYTEQEMQGGLPDRRRGT